MHANDNKPDGVIEGVVTRFSGGHGVMVVYALADCDLNPSDPENCRYIGLTCQGLGPRRSSHIGEALAKDRDGTYKSETYKSRWIRSVVSRSGRKSIVITPLIVGLSCDRGATGAGAAERAMIAAYKSAGARLTNATSGGEGVPASGGEKRVTKNEYMKRYQASRRLFDQDYVEKQRAANRKSMATKYANDNDFRRAEIDRHKARRESDPEFRQYMIDYGRAYRAKKKAERQISI